MEYNITLDYEEEALAKPLKHAGFGLRLGASFFDGILLFTVFYIFFSYLFAGLWSTLYEADEKMNDQENNKRAVTYLGLLIYIGVPSVIAVIRALFESSSWQATPGKKLAGIKVVHSNGDRTSFWRALGRNSCKILSAIILNIGYLMPLWTKKKQALHDLMSDCLVVESNHDASDYTV